MDASGDRLLSRTSISQVTDILNTEFNEFQNRDLSGLQVEYMFVDAVYESLKGYDIKQAILVAWGITREGKKILLHLTLGNKESEEDWLEMFRSMVARGLQAPTVITSDGAPGLIKVIQTMFSKSIRIRCWFHRMSNFSKKVPPEKGMEIKGELWSIRDALNYEKGKQLAAEFIDKYQSIYPALIQIFQTDLEALLSHLKLPWHHRIYVRTTNFIERTFLEEKRRTKIIPSLQTQKSILKLVFSVLIRASKRWAKAQITEQDGLFLDHLRKQLKLPLFNETDKNLKKVANL